MHGNDLTPAAERAILRASAYAMGANAKTVEPRHLLAALLEEDEGTAAATTRRHGLDPAVWLRIQPAPRNADASLDHDLGLSRVMRLARTFSKLRTPDGIIGTGLLLEGAIEADAALREELQHAGLQVADLLLDTHLDLPALPVVEEPPVPLAVAVEPHGPDRILDACGNRAREAVRVIEDYCRFACDRADLSRSWKEFRHALSDALRTLPTPDLLASRDTENDVGSEIGVPQETERASLVGVVIANIKRLQEALRSLEEFGKLQDVSFAATIERLRYRAYTLERQTLHPSPLRERLGETVLYALLSGDRSKMPLEPLVKELAAGGVGMIQVREKALTDRELLARARLMRQWTRAAGVLFIVNDRADIALLADADGVHLGQDDLTVADARRIVGPDRLVGVSTHTLDDLRQATVDRADYVGVGPAFASATKSFDRLAGLDYVRSACRVAAMPAFVLGGVSAETAGPLIEAGARRFAASSALTATTSPREAAQQLAQMLADAAALA